MIRALLLALALAGCEGQVHVESVPIAQADPTKEADWPSPGRDYPGPSMMTPEWFRAYMEARGIRPNVASPLPDSIFAPSYPADTTCYERREWGWLLTCHFNAVPMGPVDSLVSLIDRAILAPSVNYSLLEVCKRDSVVARVELTPGTDWLLVDASRGFAVYQYAESPLHPDSLTVTNATPRTLLLEQESVVTLAKPGDSLTVALEGSVTIREEASYDE